MQGKNPENRKKTSRRLAASLHYISPNQLTLEGFETPFEQKLTKENRWVKLAELIPWDSIVNLYNHQFNSTEGRPPINGRIVIGAVVIKHMLNLSDRETIAQIQENMFMQYFLGFTSFTNEPVFDPSLFVDIRERLSLEIMGEISNIVLQHHREKVQPKIKVAKEKQSSDKTDKTENDKTPKVSKNKGKLLMDATVAPQNITYPTDLKLLNAAREKSEEIIDKLYKKEMHGFVKPRTYRKKARKDFLNTNKKKSKSQKEIRQANGKQIRYLTRNLKHIDKLLATYKHTGAVPLSERDKQYYQTIKKVLEQQSYMQQEGVKTVADRIVNIHQPYVRPIVRGKEGKKVEFGSKIQVELLNGFNFLSKQSWDNFNEGTCLKQAIEGYKKQWGFYPKEVHADKIYCTQKNRKYLKEKNIKLHAKPLGRPRKNAEPIKINPGERNPIEGKFGQAKIGYGMDKIMAKLKNTSESWIGSIMLVLNLVRLTKVISSWLKLIIKNFLNFLIPEKFNFQFA